MRYFWDNTKIDRFQFKHLICGHGLLSKFERFEKKKKERVFYDDYSKLKAIK